MQLFNNNNISHFCPAKFKELKTRIYFKRHNYRLCCIVRMYVCVSVFAACGIQNDYVNVFTVVRSGIMLPVAHCCRLAHAKRIATCQHRQVQFIWRHQSRGLSVRMATAVTTFTDNSHPSHTQRQVAFTRLCRITLAADMSTNDRPM